MALTNLVDCLHNGPVIPAIRTIEDFKHALQHTDAPSLAILFGDINILPDLLSEAERYNKRLLIHVDLLEGIGRDKAGMACLARMGVSAIITTKTHLGKVARDQGMVVIQRLFIMDSEAVKTGLKMIHNFKPDAIEVLPSTIPQKIVDTLRRETGVPIFAGGFIYDEQDVNDALDKGISAVSTHEKALWGQLK